MVSSQQQMEEKARFKTMPAPLLKVEDNVLLNLKDANLPSKKRKLASINAKY